MRLVAKWQSPWTLLSDGFGQRPTRSLRVKGDRVDLVRLGRGEPLVLVPGLAGSWKLLWPLARVLARHFEVITYGLRGDRFSWDGLENGRGRVAEIGDYAQDLAALLDQLGLECPTVVGVSFGGAIALELAAEQPHRMGALIISGAEARFAPTVASTIARRVLERFPLPSDNGFVNQFFNLLYGRKPDPSPLVNFVTDRIWETDQAVMAERLATLAAYDISDRLWRIEAPTLVLAGANDVIVPPARQRALADAIPGARYAAIDEAGHIGFLTHRARFARDVRRHLRRVKQQISPQR